MIFLVVRKDGSFKHGRAPFNISPDVDIDARASRAVVKRGATEMLPGKANMQTTEAESLDAIEKRWVLGAVCLAALAMPISFTGPALALPLLARTFHGSPLGLEWVTNAFMLAFGSCMLAAGTLADLFGRKRVFLCGASAFAL